MAENGSPEVTRFAAVLKTLAQENRALKRENARLRERVAALDQARLEARELRRLYRLAQQIVRRAETAETGMRPRVRQQVRG
jgi:regulator of replication initiation timing